MDLKEAHMIQETLNLYFNLNHKKDAIERELDSIKHGVSFSNIRHGNFELIFTKDAQDRLRNFLIMLGEEQVKLLEAQMTSVFIPSIDQLHESVEEYAGKRIDISEDIL